MASKTRVASATALAMEELAGDTVRVRRELTSSSVNSRRRTRPRRDTVPAADTVRDNSTRPRRAINLSSSSIRITRARRVAMVAKGDRATVATVDIEGC